MDSPTPASPPDADRRALGDVLLVAAVYLLPNTYFAFQEWFVTFTPLPVVFSELGLAVKAVAASALGLFLILRSGEPPAAFGLTRPRWTHPFWGVLLWLGLFLVLLVTGAVIPPDSFGLPDRPAGALFPPPRTALDFALVAGAACLNGFGEEVVMRAVLQTRLERLMRSAASAVVLTAVLFALYHAYYGVVGAGLCGLVGLVLGVAFRLGRCLWPVAVAHALQDFVPMLWAADVANGAT